MAKTVVGLFDTANHAQNAIEELMQSGISRSDISLMAPPPPQHEALPDDDGANVVAGAGIGAALGGVGGLLLGLALLPIPGFGPVIAAGPIAATLAGAGIGAAAGSLIGALTEIGVPEEHALHYAEAVRRGATLVSVSVVDEMAERVAMLLDRHHAINIRERVAAWREGGWEGFEPRTPFKGDAPALPTDDTVVLEARDSMLVRDSQEPITQRFERRDSQVGPR